MLVEILGSRVYLEEKRVCLYGLNLAPFLILSCFLSCHGALWLQLHSVAYTPVVNGPVRLWEEGLGLQHMALILPQQGTWGLISTSSISMSAMVVVA